MSQQERQELSARLKELFGLELSPVAVCYGPKHDTPPGKGKVRICRAILDAAAGKTLSVHKENNACFGAAWHLGFHKIRDPKVLAMTKKFVVEGEKLFASYDALDNLMADMDQPPDSAQMCFTLSPLEAAADEPAVVLFVCNAEQACRLLTFATFVNGKMPKIKIGGPTCRLSVIYPMVTGEVNISFYDYTARKLCNVPKDKLVVSFPYKRISEIIDNIDTCSAGTAKIEFPKEFREFLQKRAGVK